MNSHVHLPERMEKLDGSDYSAYQSIKGVYDFPDFMLFIDQIPKDPYAPSHTGVYRARISLHDAGITEDMTASGIRKVALRDFLTRSFHKNCCLISSRRGTGNSGLITVSKPSQAILDRSSMILTDDYLEVRFFIGLPANERNINGKLAVEMVFEELPKIMTQSLLIKNLDIEALHDHLSVPEDAEYLRNCLESKHLIAFISNGSVLPRESGIDERPLTSANPVRFQSPESMEVSFDLPNRGVITGMGIRQGITLLVGGGYHGKSTVLNAIQYGIYNHIPGDGREFCVTMKEAMKIRASDGRYVSNVDISPFLDNLPSHMDTTAFSTKNASGSTSQAATIIESIETGSIVLLMDEDTCASNFMIRDKRMQELVPRDDEPITSFTDCVRTLYKSKDVSTVLVMGGSGDYFELADHVIQMKDYLPFDVTDKAHLLAKDFPTDRSEELSKDFSAIQNRNPVGTQINPLNEYGHRRISSPDVNTLIFGQNTVDLSDLEQLIETSQIKGIGLAIDAFTKQMDGHLTLKRILKELSKSIDSDGIDVLDELLTGDITCFRPVDFASVLNRMRSVEFYNR